ncbi:MAG TPA: hypothetical protein VF941_19095, partial [Clostridia bacterium]
MSSSTIVKDLIAVIEPDGGYTLDWDYIETDKASDTELIHRIYDKYLEDRDTALFLFGASKKTELLSETMEYLYKVSSAFVKC